MLVQKCRDELLHVAYFFRYSEFKAGLQAIQQLRAKNPDPQKLADTGRQAADSLLQLLKPQVTPERFWLPILHDSVCFLHSAHHHHDLFI
jgi:nuclear pore complex protein Nup85